MDCVHLPSSATGYACSKIKREFVFETRVTFSKEIRRKKLCTTVVMMNEIICLCRIFSDIAAISP